MSKFCFLLLFALVFSLTGCQMARQNGAETKEGSQDLHVMTFNIRNGRAEDGEDHWDTRSQLVVDLIADQSADVVGIQEAFRFQLDELNKALPQYGEIGEGRAGGTEDEYSAILYRKERFVVGESGTFWLSDRPEVPSKHWGNSHLRICTWARLIDRRSGRAFYLYNTHLDNRSQISREKSVQLIASAIQQRAHQNPFILMGDFNAPENSAAVRYLLDTGMGADSSPLSMVDSYRRIHPNTELVGTFNGFIGTADGPKIDYIFVGPDTDVVDANILRASENGRYPSDHFPLTAHLQFQ